MAEGYHLLAFGRSCTVQTVAPRFLSETEKTGDRPGSLRVANGLI